ncbi:unnamed protein product [Phytophthora fragariaefolia]|uniref:Unnamed protein product n=1 Tax=Phytophthora fragariaefolia TaxID=1490495 RepID=A0A9W6XZM5_9STRA|nr:unnamed protein product [Phytophthora fragariaefolia]
MVEDEADPLDLATLNRWDGILRPETSHEGSVARVAPVATRSQAGSRLGRSESTGTRSGGSRLGGSRKSSVKKIQQLTQDEAKSYIQEVDGLRCGSEWLAILLSTYEPTDGDRDRLMKLVVPETLQQDVLHHYHVSLEGGHQGIGPTYPFQAIKMEHISSLPKSFRGNTELLIWVDLFSGYVIVKTSGSRTAQTIAEFNEECRFGASEVIRHDREPGFVADFFRSFNRILGQRQRATMAYRPQANGTAERMVQTTTRALKMYVQDLDQRD